MTRIFESSIMVLVILGCSPKISDKPFGHTYVQYGVKDGQKIVSTEGEASYHFVREDSVYINWAKADLLGWVFDNGEPFPKNKLFINTSFDEKTNTFRGQLDFSSNPQHKVDGSTLWEYTMVFSSNGLEIAGGKIDSYDAKGDYLFTQSFDTNIWSYIQLR